MAEEKRGLNNATITLMTCIALFYDVLQIILSWAGIGWLIIPIAYLTFIVWFKMHGINFLSMKRAPTLGFGALLEVLTAGIMPSLTYTVLRIGLDSKLKKLAPGLGIINK